MPSPPTITTSTTAAVTGRAISPLSGELRISGRIGTWNQGFGYLDIGGSLSCLEFFTDAADVEFGWTEQVSNSSRFLVLVDDVPAAAEGGPGLSTSTGTTYWTRIAFGTAKRRKVTIYASGPKAWVAVNVPVAASMTPTAPKAVLCVIGDSFCDGSAGSPRLQAVAIFLARLLGMDLVLAAVGGTGYVAGSETFGSAARLAKVTETRPDLIVIVGSVNDDGQPGIQSAAAALYSELDAQVSGVPVVVFGSQPSNANDTVSANRLANRKAVKAAADAAANVAAYFDMVGGESETSLTAWSSATTYNDGAIVTYKGSVYRLRAPGGASTNQAPGTQRRWELVTYAFTGTGKVGSTAGDGTRDTLLHSDGVHPTSAGATALAVRIESDVRELVEGV